MRSLAASALVCLMTVVSVSGMAQSQAQTAPVQSPAAKPADPADQARQPVTLEDSVTVIGEAPPARTSVGTDVRTLPASADVLTSREIQGETWRDPGEVIRALPGVGFSYYGQGGIPSGPTVRGYTDRNFGQDIAGFVDGIPLNLAGFVSSHGAMDLTVLVPEAVERVELVRSPLEARYGDFNRGASLNFVTRPGIVRPLIDVSGGTYATWRVLGAFGNGVPGTRRVSVYSILDASGADGYAEHQDTRHTKLFNRVSVALPGGVFDVTALNGWSNWNAPGYLDKAAVQAGTVGKKDRVNPTDGGELQHNLYWVRFSRPGGGRFPFQATFHAGAREWQRYRHDVLIGPAQTQVFQYDDRTSWGFRAEQSANLLAGARAFSLVAGLALQHDDASTRQANTLLRVVTRQNDDVDEVLRNTGVYVQGQFAATSWMKLLGGVRRSWIDYGIDDKLRLPGQFVADYDMAATSPKVGLVLAPARAFELYANYARGMRTPTPRTEVRNSIGSIDRVEIAVTESYEAGATYRPTPRVDIRVNAWRALNSNEIRGIPPGGTQFESLGKSARDGAELDVRWYLASATRVTGGLSWVDARLLTPATPGADRLPDIPAHVHQIGFESPLGPPRSVASRFWGSLEFYAYGRKNLNTTGTIRSDTYMRGTYRLEYRSERRWRTWVSGFFYPTSQLGESEYLFGSRVGVRPNPPFHMDAGFALTF